MSNTPKKYCGLYTTLFSPEYLKKEYLEREQSLNQIAKQAGCSKKMVLLSIQKHKIPTRPNALAEHIRHKRTFNLTKLVKNYIDGLILGDGHIFQKTRFSARYDQHFAIRYKEWTEKIERDFESFGIESNTIEYMSKPRIINKTGQHLGSFSIIMLFSKFYEEFLSFRERWYQHSVKTIPLDLELTPQCLANVYMSDGDFDRTTGRVALSINSFAPNDVLLLINKLISVIDVKPKIYPSRTQDNQPRLKLSRNDSRIFLKYIESFRVSCFNYKWGIT